MPRPSLPKVFASDSNYPAGGNPWNGGLNKLDPGTSAFKEGFEPGTSPSAQKLNFVLNAQGQYIDQFDLIDIYNCTYYAFPGAFSGNPQAMVGPISPGSTNSGHTIGYDAYYGDFWTGGAGVGAGPLMFRSQDGLDWVNQTSSLPVTPSDFSCLSSDPDAQAGPTFMLGGASAQSFINWRDNVANWHSTAVPGTCTGIHQIAYVPGTHTFLLGGQGTVSGHANSPAIWLATETGGGAGLTMSQLTLNLANTFTGPISVMASGGGKSIAFAFSGNWKQWINSNLANPWTESLAPNSGAIIHAMCYSDYYDVFMAVRQNGDVWVSSDGTVWTLQPSSGVGGFLPNCLAARGAVFVAGIIIGSGHYRIAISTDLGATWKTLPWPAPNDIDFNPVSVQVIDDRFVFLSQHAAGNAVFGASLRTR